MARPPAVATSSVTLISHPRDAVAVCVFCGAAQPHL
jgi:hypothetical protein